MKNLLFLCTGNYYRSRFCEEYFNHRAQRHDLAWRADSRGLAPDLTVFRNPGPLSPYTHQALSALGVAFGASLRAPRAAQPSDFARADRLIALSRAEHQPMVERFFPAHARAVEYWEVGDLPVASPAEALETMTRAVHELIDALRGETSPAPILEHSVSRLSSSRGPTVGVDSAVDVDRASDFLSADVRMKTPAPLRHHGPAVESFFVEGSESFWRSVPRASPRRLTKTSIPMAGSRKGRDPAW